MQSWTKLYEGRPEHYCKNIVMKNKRHCCEMGLVTLSIKTERHCYGWSFQHPRRRKTNCGKETTAKKMEHQPMIKTKNLNAQGTKSNRHFSPPRLQNLGTPRSSLRIRDLQRDSRKTSISGNLGRGKSPRAALLDAKLGPQSGGGTSPEFRRKGFPMAASFQ